MLSVFLSGCASHQVIRSDAEREHPDELARSGESQQARPNAQERPRGSWWDEHPVLKWTGIGLLVIVVVTIISVAAVTAFVIAIASQMH
jgi:hypothetical protein